MKSKKNSKNINKTSSQAPRLYNEKRLIHNTNPLTKQVQNYNNTNNNTTYQSQRSDRSTQNTSNSNEHVQNFTNSNNTKNQLQRSYDKNIPTQNTSNPNIQIQNSNDSHNPKNQTYTENLKDSIYTEISSLNLENTSNLEKNYQNQIKHLETKLETDKEEPLKSISEESDISSQLSVINAPVISSKFSQNDIETVKTC